jgi:hypothetical protein
MTTGTSTGINQINMMIIDMQDIRPDIRLFLNIRYPPMKIWYPVGNRIYQVHP